jgi:S1-C subfamily serine protease
MFQVARKDSTKFFYVCITARHVLAAVAADTAWISLRYKDSSGGFSSRRHPIPIRKSGSPLWVSHPDSSIDVAGLFIAVPRDAYLPVVSTGWLATEKELSDLELRPGDEVFTLGYPGGAESPIASFPILRSGHLASYPLLPAMKTKRFALDMPVFGGNSGGPAFLSGFGREVRDTLQVDLPTDCIIGIVSSRRLAPISKESLELAFVVPSPLIQQVLQLLARRQPPL